MRLMMSARRTAHLNEDPLGILREFAVIVTLSWALAAAGSMLLLKVPVHPISAVQSYRVLEMYDKYDANSPLQINQMYKIQCIRDGFEFLQESDLSVNQGKFSYRHCEALRQTSAGVL